MRIGILSDTHDQLDRTRLAVDLLRSQQVETLFHCGDITGPEIVAACSVLPCYFVFGNNDGDSYPELIQAMKTSNAICLGWAGHVELAGQRIAMAHGHNRADIRRLLADQPQYLFSGHSHMASDRYEGPTRRINPGEFRARHFTVAVLDLQTGDLESIEIPSTNTLPSFIPLAAKNEAFVYSTPAIKGLTFQRAENNLQ